MKDFKMMNINIYIYIYIYKFGGKGLVSFADSSYLS